MFYNTKIAKQEQDNFANILIIAHWPVTERTSSLLYFLIIKKYITESGNQKNPKIKQIKTKQTNKQTFTSVSFVREKIALVMMSCFKE